MTNDGIVVAKYRILEIFSELGDETMISEIEQWISSQSYKRDLEFKKSLLNSEKKLTKIGKFIKTMVPFKAEMDSEVISAPLVGIHADCNEVNTCHVDEFLYDDAEVEKLVAKGKLQRHYCVDCNSRNIKDLIHISHSMSCNVIQYIFNVLLPKDLDDKHVLDVGSRLGGVLYGAYYYTNAATVTGIEINEECCEIQKTIINNYSMDNNRIKVIHSDIMDRCDIISKSDIIILNVPDFFMDFKKHRQMWYFFKKHIKKGSYFIINRNAINTLMDLDIYEDFFDWLVICIPQQLENEILFDVEECCDLYVYTVN